jgi:ABC-type polysaccharide/polyol phosphate export permease
LLDTPADDRELMSSQNIPATTPVTASSHEGASEVPDDVWLLPERRPSIVADLREIVRDEFWAYRGLAYELARRDLRVRYKQTLMGFAWAVLMPLLIVVSGSLVRFAMAYVGGRHLSMEELAGIAVKAIPWSFFVGSIGFATSSLVGNANLMTKIYFPREMLPLAATLAQSFDSAIGVTALLIACPLIGVHYGLAILWAPLVAVCIVLFTSGTALLAGCANLFFRDVKYLVQVLLTFGIFVTPVFFEPEMFGRIGARVMMLNPLAPLLEGLRLSIVYNHSLLAPLIVAGRHGDVVAWSPWYLAYSAACAVITFVGALVIFHRAEKKFAEYV